MYNSNRLNDDTEYIRPKKTITELVQNRKDILEILKDHEEVVGDDLDELPHNSKLKYITYDDKEGKYLFRWGGSLRKVHEKYVVLAGRGNKTFTVQRFKQKGGKLEETRFYKTVTKYDRLLEEHEELKKQSELIFDKQEHIIKTQNAEIARLRKILKSNNISH
jgi:hypothetical protein